MRTVVEEPAVSQLLDASSRQYPRLAEAFEGLKWYLARRPEAGYEHPRARPGVSLYKQAASYGVTITSAEHPPRLTNNRLAGPGGCKGEAAGVAADGAEVGDLPLAYLGLVPPRIRGRSGFWCVIALSESRPSRRETAGRLARQGRPLRT
jgi:hypothetical protein